MFMGSTKLGGGFMKFQNDAKEVNQVCKIFGTIPSLFVLEIKTNHTVLPAAAGTPRLNLSSGAFSTCEVCE